MSSSLALPTRVSQQIHTLAQQQTQPLCAYLYDLNALEEHIKKTASRFAEKCRALLRSQSQSIGPDSQHARAVCRWF